MKKPRVDLPRSLLYGSGIVMLIFLIANLGYYRVLSGNEIQGSSAVAALAVGKVMGPVSAKCISLLILVSMVGCTNGLILTGPRVYYAMARDGIFPNIFGRVNDRYRTPIIALIVQGLWAATLAASGSYQQLFTDVVFTAWVFYGMAVAAVLVLRRTQPHRKRPFSVPGYPFLSLLFCCAAALLVAGNVIQQPRAAFTGIVLVSTGLPIYFWRSRKSPVSATEHDH
jgi:APA family basic amino acid/polyamine antiporter